MFTKYPKLHFVFLHQSKETIGIWKQQFMRTLVGTGEMPGKWGNVDSKPRSDRGHTWALQPLLIPELLGNVRIANVRSAIGGTTMPRARQPQETSTALSCKWGMLSWHYFENSINLKLYERARNAPDSFRLHCETGSLRSFSFTLVALDKLVLKAGSRKRRKKESLGRGCGLSCTPWGF